MSTEATLVEAGVGTTSPTATVRPTGGGVLLALGAAAAFGSSGTLARSLLDLGWSPAALVAVRLGGAALVLLVPALLAARRWRPSRRSVLRLALYGLVAAGGAQFCYFSAIQYLPVATAILIEFTAPIWLIAVYAVLHRRRPSPLVLLAAALALVGLVLVLDVLHAGAVDPRGLAWALGAAACACGYFLLSDSTGGASEATGGTEDEIPPVLMAAAGTGLGAVFVLAVGATGLMPLAARTGTARLTGLDLPWWAALAVLVAVPTVLAYLLGIAAIRRLGGASASFLGLAEVLFAVLFSALLVAQRPGAVQLAGMVLVIAGIVLAQRLPTPGARR
ncbi:drug/metabolite transporter (DMT)-like permease [Friedmanniella endophytica]|uniref:Drug/metabolite transporter (DMT)-like permease n=1 Tax=Microlunatus kandeliicorticis TaxID=1759536 RepID=A0A7W3IQR2_9ACTN|nr:EamA family transporter [Microlunatus kandeliicorticis]MBA8793503.1 drug/metabolite transporter (DMT)-like permease [Microlunatus kandeliicorticis]